MPIITRLDRVMADRKISLNDLAQQVGITPANLSLLKTGKVRAVRFSTLEALCRILQCQPGDILEYMSGPPLPTVRQGASSPKVPTDENSVRDQGNDSQEATEGAEESPGRPFQVGKPHYP